MNRRDVLKSLSAIPFVGWMLADAKAAEAVESDAVDSFWTDEWFPITRMSSVTATWAHKNVKYLGWHDRWIYRNGESQLVRVFTARHKDGRERQIMKSIEALHSPEIRVVVAAYEGEFRMTDNDCIDYMQNGIAFGEFWEIFKNHKAANPHLDLLTADEMLQQWQK